MTPLHQNDFLLELWKSLDKDKNLIFSPVSIQSCLAMVLLAAQNTSYDQLIKLLHFDDILSSKNAASQVQKSSTTREKTWMKEFQMLFERWEGQNAKRFQFLISNAVFVAESLSIPESISNEMKHYFRGEIIKVDFIDTKKTASAINQYVEKATKGKIKEFVNDTCLDKNIPAVFINVVYFQALFRKQFTTTYQSEFHLLDGQKQSVETMELDYEFHALDFSESNLNVQIVKLPFKGANYSLVVILPSDGNFESFGLSLDFKEIRDAIKKAFHRQVSLLLPKFNFSESLTLDTLLNRFGVADLDLSGFSTKLLVIHKATIDVNETGVTATAVTAAEVHPMRLGERFTYLDITVDRPFYAGIWDEERETFLFFSQVIKPLTTASVCVNAHPHSKWDPTDPSRSYRRLRPRKIE